MEIFKVTKVHHFTLGFGQVVAEDYKTNFECRASRNGTYYTHIGRRPVRDNPSGKVFSWTCG